MNPFRLQAMSLLMSRGRVVDAFERIASRRMAEECCLYYNLLYENAYDPH